MSKKQERIDRFADYLADGDNIFEAAAKLGRAKSWAEYTLKKIREDLGWQAS